MHLTSLESGSHRPRRCRRPTWPFLLEEKVLKLRLQYPRWGEDKLVVLLQREHLSVSTSMVGRILAHLKRQGRLVEAPSPRIGRAAAPTPTRKTAARHVAFVRTGRPRNSLSTHSENVGNAHQSGLSSPSGVDLLFRNGFCSSGKANLHPLAFYTIKVTSPDEYTPLTFPEQRGKLPNLL